MTDQLHPAKMTATTSEKTPLEQVLQMAVATFDALSALLGLHPYIAPTPRPSPPVKVVRHTLQEVSEHCTPDDCWIVLYDRVYDVTKFLRCHPGGEDIIIENAGRDATSAFRSVGHSETATETMKQFLVGDLVPEECMCAKY